MARVHKYPPGVDLAQVDGTGERPGTQPVYVVNYDGDRLILGQDALFELGERIQDEKCAGHGPPRIELTDEAEQVLEQLRRRVEQIGATHAAGLADEDDEDVRLAALVQRFDELVLSWVIDGSSIEADPMAAQRGL